MKNQLLLRSYQQRLIQATTESLKRNKHTILYAPTAAGKSVLAAFMSEGAAEKGNVTLILTHRTEILKQNFKKMEMLGLKVSMINAQTKYIPDSRIFCAMSQTMAARCASEKVGKEYRELMQCIDFVIVDEVHRGDHDGLYRYFRKDVWMVGMSATILRSGNMKQLGDQYSDIVKVVKTQELSDLGFLTPSKNYAFQAPKLDDIEFDRSKGDYNQQQLQKRFMSAEKYAGVISNYQRICPGTKALCFTCGIEHCIELCRSFNEAGISAKYLVSERRPETDKEMSGVRAKLLADFENGAFDVLVNIGMTDTGLDIPAIETIILDYSTLSYARYIQPVGRGARLFDGKNHFNVLDFGGNIERFGVFESEPVCSLWHSISLGGVAPQKECPADKTDKNGRHGCLRLLPISTVDCPYCEYHFETKSEIYEADLELIVAKEQEDLMSIKGWTAAKKLEGWSTNRILVSLMMKNKDNMKAAFMEAISVLRTEKGEMVSPSYYYFIKKNILDKKRVKK